MNLNFKRIGEGRPVLILHGLFGSLDNWQTLGNKIADKGYCVYLIDQRNHGRSPHSDEWNYKSMSEDVAKLIYDESLQDVILIGHSMGGKTAMYLLNEHEELVSKLIIVDIAPKFYSVHHQKVIEALQAVDLNTISSRKEAEATMNNYLPGDKGTQQFLLKNLYWSEDKKLAWRFNLDVIVKNIDNVGLALELRFSDLPVIVIRGAKSDYVKNEDFAQIQKNLPNASLMTIENAGHWVHAEQPQAFFEAVMDFIN